MAITGQNLLTGLSQFMGDDYDNVTSATSTDGTTATTFTFDSPVYLKQGIEDGMDGPKGYSRNLDTIHTL